MNFAILRPLVILSASEGSRPPCHNKSNRLYFKHYSKAVYNYQAGAYIEETQCSLADYLQFYRIQRSELLKARGGLVPDHPEPVATTWSLSFADVEKRS